MSNDQGKSLQPDTTGVRIPRGHWWPWPIWLASGVSRPNMYVYMYSAYATIGLLTFVNTGTPLVLNSILDIPVDQQGKVSGDLIVATEIGQFIVFGIVGVLADRIGRRGLFSMGLFVMGLSYLLHPFADSIAELFVYRILYACGLGAAAGMLGTIVADYPQDVSRGKLVAFGGILNGLGVICVAIFIGNQLPPKLSSMGFDAIEVTRIMHVFVFGLCTISAIIVGLGLKKGTPAKKEERPRWKELILSGFLEGKNPRIALSYAAAFVARSDLVILGIFTVLWGMTEGVKQGLEIAEAASQGARMFATASIAALLWLFVLGAVMDRFNRITTVIFCMSLAAIGYSSLLLVENPLASEAIPYFLLLGVGQISAFFGATTLISHEAPKLKRASVIGMFNMSGAVGILIASIIGGRLFDIYGGAAPFALVGCFNACVMLLAIVVRIKSPGYIPSTAGATTGGVD